MVVLKVNNLFKSYKQKGKKINALNGMSFSLDEGEIVGFLGPNGAGKSTTIKIIMDLIRADKGYVEIMGISSELPESRKFVGFMPENPQYFDTLTGFELMLFSANFYGVKDKNIKELARELLEEFGLKEAANRTIRKYSKGMIQRLGFASAIIHNPDLLILDEPMSGLDPMGRILFKQKILELNKQGKTIFFSSHIIPDIEDICSKVLIVNKGKVVKTLTHEQIKFLTTTGFKIIIDRPSENFDYQRISDNLFYITCKKEDLKETISYLEDERVKIVDIEPVKLSLEEIFINIISD